MIYSSNERKNLSILDGLRLLCEPRAVYELRCPKTKRDGTISGYFNDLEKLADHAELLSGVHPAVYVTINPVNPDLLARARNRIENRASFTTADADVVKRLRLLLDFDPKRPAGISSTDEEHDAALARAKECLEWLTAQGFPKPILADSGNGGHLIYGLDLPNDDACRLLVESFLKAIAGRFTDEKVKGDVSVFNAARISKIYGTMVCKGDNLPDRPHRLSQILEAPEKLVPVSNELLQIIGNIVRPVKSGSLPEGEMRTALVAEHRRLSADQDASERVESFLDRHHIGVQHTKEGNGKWRNRWILDQCPFCESEDGAAVLTVSDTGKIGFRCQHNRCSEPRKRWADFRKHYEPNCEQPCQEDHDEVPQAKQGRVASLVEHALSHCDLVLDDASEQALAKIPRQGWNPLESSAFRRWLVRSFKEATGQMVRGSDVADALLNLAAHCHVRRRTYHRVASEGGCLYLDLCRDDGKAVKISSDGWKVLDNPPVVFLRKKDMGDLPIPQQGRTIDELRQFVNVSDADFNLYLAWLLDALKGRKPYSILVVNGEQGAGKSTFSVLTGEILDPCREAKTKSLPKDVRDLAVLASNRHLLAFDNISWLSEEISDALCRLATGSGMVLRSLYSNAEEQIFGGARPMILNGIPEIGDRSDFLGRTMKITLRAIPEEQRQDEKALFARFLARRSFLLGALCSLLANGLKNENRVADKGGPRMADTYHWLQACEMGTGRNLSKPFAENLKENVKGFALETLFGRSLVMFLQNTNYVWKGTANKLHDALRPNWDIVCGSNLKDMGRYPSTARVLSGELNKLGASLRENGIIVERERTWKERVISLDAQGYFQGKDSAQPTEAPPVLTPDRAPKNNLAGIPCEENEPDQPAWTRIELPGVKEGDDELDADAILSRYTKRYGKEEAEAERLRGLDPVRLHTLDAALTSAEWIPNRGAVQNHDTP